MGRRLLASTKRGLLVTPGVKVVVFTFVAVILVSTLPSSTLCTLCTDLRSVCISTA